MRSLAASLLAFGLGISCLSAQTNATDVGIRLIGPTPTTSFGQTCGTVTCTPIAAGSVSPATNHPVTVYGANSTPYILAIGRVGKATVLRGI